MRSDRSTYRRAMKNLDLDLGTADQLMIPIPTTTTSCTLVPGRALVIALCLALVPCPDIARIPIWDTQALAMEVLDTEVLPMEVLPMGVRLTEEVLLTEAQRRTEILIHHPHREHILPRHILLALPDMREALVVPVGCPFLKHMDQFQCQRVPHTEAAV